MKYLIVYESSEEIKSKIARFYNIRRVLKKLRSKGVKIFYIEEY